MYSLEETWQRWIELFLDTYWEKGWVDVALAYSYKYIKGTLIDYAVKKLNLLLEADSNHIVSGGPQSFQLNTQPPTSAYK